MVNGVKVNGSGSSGSTFEGSGGGPTLMPGITTSVNPPKRIYANVTHHPLTSSPLPNTNFSGETKNAFPK